MHVHACMGRKCTPDQVHGKLISAVSELGHRCPGPFFAKGRARHDRCVYRVLFCVLHVQFGQAVRFVVCSMRRRGCSCWKTWLARSIQSHTREGTGGPTVLTSARATAGRIPLPPSTSLLVAKEDAGHSRSPLVQKETILGRLQDGGPHCRSLLRSMEPWRELARLCPNRVSPDAYNGMFPTTLCSCVV